MAKIAFSKLGLTKDKLDEFQTVEFNDQTVEVKQYLPIAEKAELISRVLNNSVDDDDSDDKEEAIACNLLYRELTKHAEKANN